MYARLSRSMPVSPQPIHSSNPPTPSFASPRPLRFEHHAKRIIRTSEAARSDASSARHDRTRSTAAPGRITGSGLRERRPGLVARLGR